MYLGAHMSISGGMKTAVDRAAEVGATALQVFVKSSNQWSARPFDDGEPEIFRSECEKAGLTRFTLAHTSYLINLASPKDGLWNRSQRALGVEVERCLELGIPYLVLHPGSHVGSGEENGLDRIVRALDNVLDEKLSATEQGTMVLLETTAGTGSNLGCRFEHLAHILEHARNSRHLGVCFDTCHTLAAGYEFRTEESYGKMFDEFDRIVGLDRLAAFHLNDSKTDLGSRRDRHEHIGKGFLGIEPFRFLMNDDRFKDLPMVLETPKGKELEEDRENLSVLRGLVEQ